MANQNGKADSTLLKVPHDNIVNRSLSLKWRIFHGTHSMLGGLCLTAGSSMYFSEIVRCYSIALTLGGCLLTIGSFFLLLADLQEWWYKRRDSGFVQKYYDEYELSNKNILQPSRSSRLNRWKRNKIRINFFAAACGSALYVAGSFLLIPTFEKYVILGNWLVIGGSAIIFLSASWKIYRTSHINVEDPYDHRFRLANILYDMSALTVDVFVGLGGACYFIGVILCLPSFSKDDFNVNRSAAFCVTGGSFFFLASIFLQFRYYCNNDVV